MFHDFVPLPNSFNPNRYLELTGSYRDDRLRVDNRVRVGNSAIEYLEPTLKWIPSFNPDFRNLKSGWGLNVYGVTGIGISGAAVLAPLCRAWSAVFADGPPVLKLPIGWDVEAQGPSMESIDRDDAVSSLSALADMADTVVQRGTGWILHLGI